MSPRVLWLELFNPGFKGSIPGYIRRELAVFVPVSPFPPKTTKHQSPKKMQWASHSKTIRWMITIADGVMMIAVRVKIIYKDPVVETRNYIKLIDAQIDLHCSAYLCLMHISRIWFKDRI